MDLSKYNNSEFNVGAGLLKRLVWYVLNALLFHSWLFPISGAKCRILRSFGAKMGRGVVIKPRVNIKYPWNIEIGDYVWLGEGSWLDSLVNIKIGSNVCISQDAYLLTGNHDYKDPHVGLITKNIIIEDGVWVGAKAVVCPGSIMKQGSILTVGSILTGSTEECGIYQGNPAVKIRHRKISS